MPALDYQTLLNIQKQMGQVPGSILQAIQGPRQDQLQMGANRLNATVAAQGQQQSQQMQALQMMAGLGIQSKQADAQRAESERMREYQSAEAEKQRQFQKDMWMLQNGKRGGGGGRRRTAAPAAAGQEGQPIPIDPKSDPTGQLTWRQSLQETNGDPTATLDLIMKKRQSALVEGDTAHANMLGSAHTLGRRQLQAAGYAPVQGMLGGVKWKKVGTPVQQQQINNQRKKAFFEGAIH
jgi:hypothetical protein